MASGSFLVVAPAMLGVFFAFWLFTRKLSKISLNARVPRSHSSSSMSRSDVDEASDESLVRRMETGSYAPDALANLRKIYRDIQEGAQAFLAAEYRMCVVFLVGFVVGFVVLVVLGLVSDLDIADVCFAVLEVVDPHCVENTRTALDAANNRGRLPARGDGHRGYHKTIIVRI
mgnify:CR=1 FL=1